MAASKLTSTFVLDPVYEDIAAPKYFDFARTETQDDIARVEAWFGNMPADPMSRTCAYAARRLESVV